MSACVLVALDSVGVDPLGHDRPESVYAESRFLFPRGRRGPLLELSEAPRPGALVETDVTGGRAQGSIECAITYTSIFSGRDALAEHGLMEGLGLRDALLEQLVRASNLFRCFPSATLANAVFPLHFPFLRSSYLEDELPAVTRTELEAAATWRGEPLRLSGPDKRGLAELFTLAEINQNIFVFAAQEAGLRLRDAEDLRAGRALSASLTHELEGEFDLRAFGVEAPPRRTPEEAAATLAALAGEHAFCFYKYQIPDLVSHTGRVDLARATFATIERFLEALLAALPAEATLVVTSDHGHLEQVVFERGHPKSKVPTWVFGPDALDRAAGLTQPTAIFELLAGLG